MSWRSDYKKAESQLQKDWQEAIDESPFLRQSRPTSPVVKWMFVLLGLAFAWPAFSFAWGVLKRVFIVVVGIFDV